MARIDPIEAEQLFQPHEAPAPVPADSPISVSLREALTWLREHGVAECRLENIGSFTFRPPESKPEPAGGAIDLSPDAPVGDKRRTVVGGYDEETLFAHVASSKA